MAAPSFDDLFNLGRAEMLIRRPDLFLSPGDVTDFLVAAAAAMADKTVHFGAEQFRKTFIDGATGDDLAALVLDHFNIVKSPATAATVTLSLARTSGALPDGNLPMGFKVSTEADENGERQEYTLNSSVAWSAAESATKTVVATCVNTGRAGNVGAGEITNLVDAPFDPVITVTNLAVAAGGNEEETDVQLRERTRAFPSTLRRGTLAALEFGAKIVPEVRVATATEDESGLVTVFVTDDDGNSNAQMVDDVIAELENWRAAGIVVGVTGGSVLTQAISLELTVKSGTDIGLLEADIIAAIEARVAKLPVGDGTETSEGVLRREIIAAAAISVDPDNIIGCDVLVPTDTVVPTAGQIIRAGTITVTEA